MEYGSLRGDDGMERRWTTELRKSQMNSISRGYWSGGMEGDRLGPGSGVSPEIPPKCRMNCGAQTTIGPPLNHHWTMSSDAFTKTEASKHQTWGACLAKVTTSDHCPSFLPSFCRLGCWIFASEMLQNTTHRLRFAKEFNMALTFWIIWSSVSTVL